MVNSIWSGKLKFVLIISVLLRVAAALYLGNDVTSLPGTADQLSYHNLALRVLDGHGFTFAEDWWPITPAGEATAHWSYLYTLYLVAVYAIFGPIPLVARLIQAVIVGLLQPYLVYLLVYQVANFSQPSLQKIDKEKVALVAAAITAVYIYFFYYTATLMTEPFYITAILANFVLTLALADKIATGSYKKLALALGLSLSITVLLRQLFLLFLPFLFLWLIFVSYKQRHLPRAIIALGLATAVLIAAILPITIFNQSRFDKFVLLNTNAGYAFFWANHPIYGTRFISATEMGETYQKLVPHELRHLNEAALDQALLKEGIQFVVDDPVRYILLSLSRIPAYFKFWPDSTSSTISNLSRVGSFALFLPFMLYGLIRPLLTTHHPSGKRRLTRPNDSLLLLYLFMLIYTAIHILTWSQIRYRLPVDSLLIIFAALAIVELWQTIPQRLEQRQIAKQS